MKHLLKYFFISCFLMLTGCTIINSSQKVVYVEPGNSWAITTFANNTEIPQAGSRAMSITAGVLRSKGFTNLIVYQPRSNCNQLIICPNQPVPIGRILDWAEDHHIRYVMMGSVNEWDYKVGLDGEPVAAVALQLYDAYEGEVLWSSVGSKTGQSRSGLGNIAQDLIEDMLDSLVVYSR